jgi:hypothetical protein
MSILLVYLHHMVYLVKPIDKIKILVEIWHQYDGLQYMTVFYFSFGIYTYLCIKLYSLVS